ncbi:MAG: radical SAM protein [Polyangiaceae bacterium]
MPTLRPPAIEEAARLQRLDRLTQRSRLVADLEDGTTQCRACARRCGLAEGERGACGVRSRSSDEILAPYGYVTKLSVDTLAAHAIYHVMPGALALTFGAVVSGPSAAAAPSVTTALGLVDRAAFLGCNAIAAAYGDPLVAAEWTRDVFAHAKERGLVTALVTSGRTTPEVVAFLRDVTDAIRVDVSADDETAWRTIEQARKLGLWVEVVTPLAPASTDVGLLRAIADRLARIDPRIPWHLHGARAATSVGELLLAMGCAYGRGLRFVYASNARNVEALRHTLCPRCRVIVVERSGVLLTQSRLIGGRCHVCGARVPGRWRLPVREAAGSDAVGRA